MKKINLDPEMLKANRELFSDLVKWLLKGKWLIFLGGTFIFIYLINLISPDPKIPHIDRLLKVGVISVIFGVLLLGMNSIRKKKKGNEKTG
jgi:hypothetical protein